jgi:hypothetical protein
MAYLLYLTGSLAGVALMVGLCYLLFGGRSTRLGVDDATRRLRAEVAGFVPGEIAVDVEGSAALVENARDHAVHLVVSRGDALVTRKVGPRSLRRLEHDGATLTLGLADFTLGTARLVLADRALAAEWQARLARYAA